MSPIQWTSEQLITNKQTKINDDGQSSNATKFRNHKQIALKCIDLKFDCVYACGKSIGNLLISTPVFMLNECVWWCVSLFTEMFFLSMCCCSYNINHIITHTYNLTKKNKQHRQTDSQTTLIRLISNIQLSSINRRLTATMMKWKVQVQ